MLTVFCGLKRDINRGKMKRNIADKSILITIKYLMFSEAYGKKVC